ncbi:S8 family serine peptidase [Streptomyces sp. NPDC004787]|uniref:S8 family peptidase n=1 Tax=Streptomyces sp. NPDC004787 TaxID=3154291 RepID=UPI0033ADF4F5
MSSVSGNRRRVRRWLGRGVAGVLGVVVFGVGATPAYAESVRQRQWHLTSLHAEEIWQHSTGEGMTVALIGTGVKEVPELAGRLLPGVDFPGAGTAGDEDGGTVAASVVAGTGKGPGGRASAYGVAPGARILPLNISDGLTGSGGLADQERAVDAGLPPALRYAADSDARIILVSVELPILGYDASPEVREAVAYAMGKGKLVLAGVGDGVVDEPVVTTPAGLPGVVGVTALDRALDRVQRSGVGDDVDLAAPGADIVSACAGGTGLCRTDGTRVAAAVAAGSAAVVWAAHPDWTRNQVLRVLLNTVAGPDDGAVRNDSIGYGAVRPLRALKTPGDPGPADVFPFDDYAQTPATPTPPATSGSGAPPSSAPPSGASAGPGTGGHSTGFWIALGVSAAGLLCLAVGTPLLVAELRRGKAGATRTGGPGPGPGPGPEGHAPTGPVPAGRR